MMESNAKKDDSETLRAIISDTLIPLAYLGAFGQLFYQIYLYLREGQWTPFSMLHVVMLGSSDFARWLAYPTDWIGVSKALGWLLNTFAPGPFILICLYLLKSVLPSEVTDNSTISKTENSSQKADAESKRA